jgi:hypothetical protein
VYGFINTLLVLLFILNITIFFNEIFYQLVPETSGKNFTS